MGLFTVANSFGACQLNFWNSLRLFRWLRAKNIKAYKKAFFNVDYTTKGSEHV